MQSSRLPFCASRAACGALLGLAATMAQAQSHVERQGPYLLRSSSVSTLNLAPESARKHGIERAADRAVLNVVVQKVEEGNQLRTVPAEVTAQVRTLAGVVQEVQMSETRSGDYVAYSGVYNYLPREVIDIMVNARPAGAQTPLEITYRERMWARQ